MKVPGILKNKYVFYALAVLAVLNVVGYVSVQAYECLALFALTAYSANCYCNNQSVAILAALFVANFVFGCGRVKEGFEDAFKGPVEHLTDATASIQEAYTCSNHNDDSEACKGALEGTQKACKWIEAREARAASGDTPAVTARDAACEQI